MAAANRDLIRAINRFSILNAIRNAKLISRVDIARSTGLSQASVTGITADLIRENLILEKSPGESIGGRKPILLSLNPKGAIVVGVKLSIYEISIVIINFEATIIGSHAVHLEKKAYSPEETAEILARAVQTCLWQENFSKDQISGIGIGLPGWVDSTSGMVRYMPNYQWENANLKNLVEEKLDLPTFIENDANTQAIAEQWFGAGKGVENFLVVTLEYGIGMGAVINGQLYRGQNGISSEFGHSIINIEGPQCRCGKRGCIEAMVGENAILRDAGQAALSGHWKRKGEGVITIEEVIQTAKAGEQNLREIYSQAGIVLGVGITNLIQLYDPEKIIITGKSVLAGELLFKSMVETIPENLVARSTSNTEIIIQNWTYRDWARGAGTVALQEIYKSPAHQMIPLI
jgi:predicted NBD/HSP70 family sugar kinase